MSNDESRDVFEDDGISWSKMTFKELEEHWSHREETSEASYDALIARYEAIMNMTGVDYFSPPGTPVMQKLLPAVCEVLSRLPWEEFDALDGELGFIVEDPLLAAFAMAVPGRVIGEEGKKQGCDQIVFFHSSWELSPKALVALVAHEVAHLFETGPNYHADEMLANRMLIEWGFKDEYDALQEEKKRLSKRD